MPDDNGGVFRHILVPVDGSAFSRSAVPYALALATAPDAVIELVSALDPASLLTGSIYPGDLSVGAPAYGSGAEVPVGAPEMMEASRRRIEKQLEATAEEIQASTEATVRWKLLEGEPSEAIAAQVETGGAELVVMSTHGRGGLERAWLGSVADRLIRRVDIPVLLVRPEAEADRGREAPHVHAVRRVLVPLDGSQVAEAALGPASRIAEQAGASLVLLRVTEPDRLLDPPYSVSSTPRDSEKEGEDIQIHARRYLTDVADRMRSRGVEVEDVEVREGAPASAILDLVGEHGDMVAMATHGRGGIKRWLLGSVSDKVLRGADLPVLLVRPGTTGGAG